MIFEGFIFQTRAQEFSNNSTNKFCISAFIFPVNNLLFEINMQGRIKILRFRYFSLVLGLYGYFKWIDGKLEFEDSMTQKLLNQFLQESGSHVI